MLYESIATFRHLRTGANPVLMLRVCDLSVAQCGPDDCASRIDSQMLKIIQIQ